MKRNCRRDENEKAIHDRATKARRMTDAQLCAALDAGSSNGPEIIERFLHSLGTRSADGTRISDATIRKLRAAAVEKGFLPG